MLGVARAHLDEIAVVAGHVMDLEYLWELGQRLGDAILGPGFVAANSHEGQQARSSSGAGASPTGLEISTWVSRALA